MTAPAPGPQSASLAAAVESLALQVDRDTVLQARAALLGEAQRLKDEIGFRTVDMQVGECGRDPVSSDAAPAFNERIAVLIQNCQQYTEDLEAAAGSLSNIARQYGFTESEISQSFGS